MGAQSAAKWKEAFSPNSLKRFAGRRHPGGPVGVQSEQSTPDCDNEGRPFSMDHVVVNFANVGSTYGERVLKRKKERGERLFDFEGVRRCIKHLTQNLGIAVIGVIHENFWWKDESGNEGCGVPDDVAAMCETVELTPRITGQQHRSADDEMTIKCAYRRNCRFLDNDNYQDWLKALRDEKVRSWLNHCQDILQMRYYFDTGLGTFDTLDGNVIPVPRTATCTGPLVKRARNS